MPLIEMTGHRRKIVCLAALILCGSLLAKFSVQSRAEHAEPERPGYKTASLFANDPNFSTNTNRINSGLTGSNQDLFFKMMLSVLLVIALGAAAIYASKKLLPKIAHDWIGGKQIRIVETQYLGPKKAIHLIEIDNQRLLIGSTSQGITLLAELGEAAQRSNAPHNSPCAYIERPIQEGLQQVESQVDNPLRV